VTVQEVSEGGSVPDLLVENSGDTRVLFLEGEELVGAKQNRILNTSVDAAPDGPAWPDEHIADAVEVSRATVERVRQRFVEQGLQVALVRKQPDRPNRQPTLDGAAEARLIALACSQPPAGRAAWTLRLLADKLVELEVVGSICHETVRQVLKKTSLSRT
jgi:transposase